MFPKILSGSADDTDVKCQMETLGLNQTKTLQYKLILLTSDVHQFVSPERRAIRELLSTKLTFKRLFSCMNTFMGFPMPFPCEGFFTIVTLIWLFTSMDSKM
jgi:hypothetical protein